MNVREHDVVRKANTGGGTVEVGGTHRVRTTVHGVQFVYAEAGDTQASLAKDLDLMPWQIRTYNEVGKQHEFKAGDRIYMQPKKAHAATPWYTVRSRPNPVADLPNARHPNPCPGPQKQPRARRASASGHEAQPAVAVDQRGQAAVVGAAMGAQ